MQDLKDLKRYFSRVLSRGTGPRDTVKKSVPFTVGRGPVPRHASVGETALVGVRFSRGSGTRGGQAPALRARKGFASPSRGTGTRATVKKRAADRRARACPSPCLGREGNGFIGVRFSRGSDDRGGQAPALRARKGSPRHAPFGSRRARTTVSNPYNLANLGNLGNPAHLWSTRANAGDRPPRYGPGRGSPLHASVREQALPNYSLLRLSC